jgi:hypothetical protein
MSQTSGKDCGLPGPMRWLHAGGDLSRPNSIHQCADRALRRFEHPPKRLLHSADLPYVQTRKSNPVRLTSIIELGAGIKSHSARCSAGAQLPATSCLGAFWRCLHRFTSAQLRVEGLP